MGQACGMLLEVLHIIIWLIYLLKWQSLAQTSKAVLPIYYTAEQV